MEPNVIDLGAYEYNLFHWLYSTPPRRGGGVRKYSTSIDFRFMWFTITAAVGFLFKSKKELNYDEFVDLNIGILSHLRIYRMPFFLFDVMPQLGF